MLHDNFLVISRLEAIASRLDAKWPLPSLLNRSHQKSLKPCLLGALRQVREADL